MKKLFVLLPLLLIYVHFYSQINESTKVNLSWGEEIKASKRGSLSDVIGYDNNAYYMLKSESNFWAGSKDGLFIVRIDKNLNVEKSEKIELKDNDNTYRSLRGLLYFNEQLVMLSSRKAKKERKNVLYLQTIDKETLKAGEKRVIGEIYYEKHKYSGEFDYTISRDKSKLMVYYGMPFEKEGPEKFGFQIYDMNLELLWEKDVSLPYNDDLFSVERFKVDNKGNAFLSGISFKEKKRGDKRKGEPNFVYHILSYTNEGQEINDYEIIIEDKFITDLQFDILENGDLICGGFYSNKGTISIKGSYFLSIDEESKQILKQSFKDFDFDFITDGLSERRIAKAHKKEQKGKSVELYEYDLDEIVLRDDGGVLLIAEQYFVRAVTSHYTDPNTGVTTTRTTYHYYYNDILTVNINPDGSIEWVTKIKKYQHSTNDGGYYSSYARSIVDGSIFFIYNQRASQVFEKDEIKNSPVKKGEYLTIVTELKPDGTYEEEMLFSSKNAGSYTRPKVCEQINEKSMIVFTKKKKVQRFAKVEFK